MLALNSVLTLKRKNGRILCLRGYTMIELIVSITLVAVVIAAMTPFLMRSLTASSSSLFEFKRTLELSNIMESINRDYLNNYTTDLETLRTRINTKVFYGTGIYTIKANKYVVYTDSNSDRAWSESDDLSGSNKVLRVTITNTSGTSFTRIFVKQ